MLLIQAVLSSKMELVPNAPSDFTLVEMEGAR